MKKAIRILLAVLLVSVIVVTFAACSEQDPCQANGHKWDEGTYTLAPTCKDVGKAIFRCKVCGEEEEREVPKTEEHKWGEGVLTTEPTCAEPGVRTYTCSVCQTTKTEKVDSTGKHTKGEAVAQVDATCHSKGTKAYWLCTDCGAKLNEAGVVVTDADLEIDMLAHVWDNGTITKDPTCTETGTKLFKCTNSGCIETFEQELKTTDHVFGRLVDKVDPTCTTDGHLAYYQCEECKQYFTEEHEPTTWKQLFQEKLGHQERTLDKVDPTCTSTGFTEGTVCDRCGETLKAQQPLDKLPHTPVPYGDKAATCEAKGYQGGQQCSVCHTVLVQPKEVPATGHSFYYVAHDDDEQHTVRCHNCDYNKLQDCQVGFIWESDGDYHWHVCTLCGGTCQHASHELDEAGKQCVICHEEITGVTVKAEGFDDHQVSNIPDALAYIKEHYIGVAATVEIYDDRTVDNKDRPLVLVDGMDVTLNLNGHTVTLTDPTISAGTLTFHGGSVKGTINYNGGTLNFNEIESAEQNVKVVLGNFTCDNAKVYFDGVLRTHKVVELWQHGEGTRNHYHECAYCSAHLDEADCQVENKFDNTNHWVECKTCHKKYDVTAHTMAYQNTGEGTHKHYCTKCEYVDSADAKCTPDTTENKGLHSDENDHWYVCASCNTEYGRKEHKYGGYVHDENANTHTRVCADCGRKDTAQCANLVHKHDDQQHWDECPLCHEKYNVENHVWTYEQSEKGHTKSCTGCDVDAVTEQCEAKVPADEHDPDHQLNTADGWYADADSHWKVCKDCGKQLEKEAHNFDKEESGEQCTVCGHLFFDVKISDGKGDVNSVPTIAEAFAWIKDHGSAATTYTVTLTHNRSDNSSATVTVPAGFNIVLDLAGFNVTYPNGALEITSGSLEVKGGTFVVNKVLYSGGTLKLPAGTYEFEITGTTCDKADVTVGGVKVKHDYSFVSDGATQHHEHCSICQHDKGKQNHNWSAWTSTGDTHDRKCNDCGQPASEGHNLKARPLTEGDVLHQHELYCEDCDYSKIVDHDFHSGTADCECGEKLCKEVTDVLTSTALNLSTKKYEENTKSATVNSVTYSMNMMQEISQSIRIRGSQDGHGYIYNKTAFPARILYIELKFVGTNPGVTLYVGAESNPNKDANKVSLVAVEGAINTFRWTAKDGENFTYFRLYNGENSEALISSITIFYQIGTHVWKDAPELHVDAGCETTGKDVRVCERCGKQETTILDARGHGFDKGFEKIEKQDATCTEQGRAAYYRCKDCGQLFSDAQHSVKIESVDEVEKIPALGHDVTGVLFTNIDGTNHGQKCKRVGCDEYDNISEHVIEQCYDKDNHWQGCKTCGFVQGQKEAHNFGDDGNEIVCRTCGAPNPNHKHVWGTPVGANEPTCTEAGNPAYVQCTSCLHYFSSTEDGAEDYGTEVPVTPAKGHDYTGVEFTPIPGMSQHGKLCKNGCGTYSEQDDHHYTIVGDKVDDAYHTAKCVCGEETQQVHNFKDDQGGWLDQCACGEERLSTGSVTLDRAYLGIDTGGVEKSFTTAETIVNDDIGVKFGWIHLAALAGADRYGFQAAKAKKGAVYNTTAMPGIITKIVLTYDAGDKSGQSLKLTLGTSKQPSKAYDMTSDGLVYTWEATANDEFTFFELQGTVGDSKIAYVVSIQIFYETCPHTVVDGSVKDQPGCATPGTSEGTCIRCGKTVTAEIPATGHEWVEMTATDPTCTEPAYRHQWYCSKCHKYTVHGDVMPPENWNAGLSDTRIVDTGKNEGNPLGHEMVWKHDDGGHWKECTRYDGDVCTETEKETGYTTHDVKEDGESFYYGSDSEGHWRTCPTCQWESTKKTGHTGDPCTVCDYTTKSVKVVLDKVETIYAENLADALSQVKGASDITITLLKSISGAGFTYDGEAKILIDLNGKTYTATSDSTIDGATMFKISGGTFKGNITVNSDMADLNDGAILQGNLTVSGGQFSLSEGTSITGNVNVAGTFILSLNTSVDGQVTVSGEFTLENTAEVTGKLVVTAGTATVKGYLEEVEISGGALKLTDEGCVATLNVKVADSTVSVNIGDNLVDNLNIEVTGDAANVTITINGTQQAFGATLTVTGAKCSDLVNVTFGSTQISHTYVDQKDGNHKCSICDDSKAHDVKWTDLHNGNHSGKCNYCDYTVESEEHVDLEPVDEKCDKCGGQIGLPYEHKSIDDLVANPPTDTEIYIVEGIWQHKGGSDSIADDVYGNGFLYDPISGNKIEHYGMVENEEAFKKAYDSSENKFTNPKTFKSTQAQFSEGDQIQLGVVYDKSHSDYYSFFIKRTEVKANIYYSATTDFNSEGGTVTIDNANALIYGQSVEIKITVTDGYKVSSVKHNDTPITENGGKYTFTVVPGPNKISVVFVEAGSETTIEITMNKSQGFQTGKDVTLSNGFTFRFNTGSGNQVSTFNDSDVRIMQTNAMIITAPSGKNITKIVFTFGSSKTGNLSADSGTYQSGTWTGKATNVTFTNAAGAAQARITKISITFE